MAKQPKENDKAEKKTSLDPVKSKLTQRERNLQVKQKLIEEGKHPKPKPESAFTQRERNLQNKKLLKDGKQAGPETNGEGTTEGPY